LFSRVMRVGLLTGLRPERRARVLSRPIFSGPVNRHRSVQRGKLLESFRYFLPAFEPFCWEQARRGRDRQRNISFCRRLLLCSYGCCERVAGNFGRQSSTGRFIHSAATAVVFRIISRSWATRTDRRRSPTHCATGGVTAFPTAW